VTIPVGEWVNLNEGFEESYRNIDKRIELLLLGQTTLVLPKNAGLHPESTPQPLHRRIYLSMLAPSSLTETNIKLSVSPGIFGVIGWSEVVKQNAMSFLDALAAGNEVETWIPGLFQ
jgi:hypothetical protein